MFVLLCSSASFALSLSLSSSSAASFASSAASSASSAPFASPSNTSSDAWNVRRFRTFYSQTRTQRWTRVCELHHHLAPSNASNHIKLLLPLLIEGETQTLSSCASLMLHYI